MFQLLTRLDQAIDKALTLGILTDEINHQSASSFLTLTCPPRNTPHSSPPTPKARESAAQTSEISLPTAPILIEIASHSYPHPCLQVSTYSLRGDLPLNSSGHCQYDHDRTLTKVLQYVIRQEVMTHIDVGDDNSTPEQNMLRTERIELSHAF